MRVGHGLAPLRAFGLGAASGCGLVRIDAARCRNRRVGGRVGGVSLCECGMYTELDMSWDGCAASEHCGPIDAMLNHVSAL